MRQKIAMQKSRINRSKRVTNKQQIIARLDNDFKTLGKYRERIAIIPEVVKPVGTGVYTHTKKRNAYKIDPIKQVYGGLLIDVPKLYGQLKLIAHKNGQKVYDKQVNFDALDLLTKSLGIISCLNLKIRQSNTVLMVVRIGKPSLSSTVCIRILTLMTIYMNL